MLNQLKIKGKFSGSSFSTPVKPKGTKVNSKRASKDPPVLPDRMPTPGSEDQYEYMFPEYEDLDSSDRSDLPSSPTLHLDAKKGRTPFMITRLLGLAPQQLFPSDEDQVGDLTKDPNVEEEFDAHTIATTDFDDDEETLKLGETPPPSIKKTRPSSSSSRADQPKDFSKLLVNTETNVLRRMNAQESLDDNDNLPNTN